MQKLGTRSYRGGSRCAVLWTMVRLTNFYFTDSRRVCADSKDLPEDANYLRWLDVLPVVLILKWHWYLRMQRMLKSALFEWKTYVYHSRKDYHVERRAGALIGRCLVASPGGTWIICKVCNWSFKYSSSKDLVDFSRLFKVLKKIVVRHFSHQVPLCLYIPPTSLQNWLQVYVFHSLRCVWQSAE